MPVKERPILFSGPMVKAILEGRKTQTRRLNGLESVNLNPDARIAVRPNGDGTWHFFMHDGGNQRGVKFPYGQPGDRLWVRESFDVLPVGKSGEPNNIEIAYWADSSTKTFTAPADYNPMIYGVPKVRPSIHMPRWASRITLEITGVRVERLQDIGEDDAQAEGAKQMHLDDLGQTFKTYKRGFQSVWESINGPDSWDANPWVWCVSFKRVTP